jgi:methyl-accepting chemotaxis protein
LRSTSAAPHRRIGSTEALLELASGNKTVAIPFTERGDEVGDNARAAHTFKNNLIRIEPKALAAQTAKATDEIGRRSLACRPRRMIRSAQSRSSA